MVWVEHVRACVSRAASPSGLAGAEDAAAVAGPFAAALLHRARSPVADRRAAGSATLQEPRSIVDKARRVIAASTRRGVPVHCSLSLAHLTRARNVCTP